VNRRGFPCSFAGAAIAGATSDCDFAPCEEIWNARRDGLTEPPAHHPIVILAWQDIDPRDAWDMLCHLCGNGDGGTGAWFNPAMHCVPHPHGHRQRLFSPLLGVLPLISLDALTGRGPLAAEAAFPLLAIREHGALAFDFIPKRRGASHCQPFASCVFATRPFFVSAA